MKPLLTTILVLLFSFGAKAQNLWITDYTTALERAQTEDKAILINFTGMDWCESCVKLQNEVFGKADFKRFAHQNLVLVEIDFPKKKILPKELKAANEALAEKFEMKSVPAVLILDKNGNKLAKTGYIPGGPTNYIANILRIPGFRANSSQPTQAPVAPSVPDKKPEQPAYTIPAPVIRYDELALKGISGGRVPMALINNKSFAAGEKAKVKVGDKTVEILVKEIRDKSVLAEIEGESEPRELKLKDPAVKE